MVEATQAAPDGVQPPAARNALRKATPRLTHLQRLEAESIHIMRETVAEAENPVMLYSIGKDSSAMLHVAIKAFYPSPPPFALLHVDTTWKFQAMYAFREKILAEIGDGVDRPSTTLSAWRRGSIHSIMARRRTRTCGRPGFEAGARHVRVRCSVRRRAAG